jgi:hypothetical protein
LLQVPVDIDARQVIADLALPAPRAVLILNGGAAELTPELQERLAGLFAELAGLIVEEKITVITGGTEAGVFGLFGQALSAWSGPTAPCLGVAITGQSAPKILEPHHTHFVLVEGNNWSDETPVMYRLATVLAEQCLSLAMFAGGGAIVIDEMLQNVAQARQMILLAGSGRSTDAVINMIPEPPPAGSQRLTRLSQLNRFISPKLGISDREARLRQIRREGRITVFDIAGEPTAFAALVRSRLLNPGE